MAELRAPDLEQQPVTENILKETKGTNDPVDFDGPDDPYRPVNWTFRNKVITTLLYGLTTGWITFASAIYSSAVKQISDVFKVNSETSTAGISMVVFGFGLGPLLWAPLSEVYGRKWAVLTVSARG